MLGTVPVARSNAYEFEKDNPFLDSHGSCDEYIAQGLAATAEGL
jgi:hypothetical protein